MTRLAVGFFDGVHVGHRQILAHADQALTFRNHPLSLLAPERAPRLLMTVEERVHAIADALAPGAPRVRSLEFTREFAALSAEEFVLWLRREYLYPVTICCGANWRFGAGGKGDAQFLRERGFKVKVEEFAQWEGGPVSSTRIREAVGAGRMEAAAAMLGRAWRMCGEVVRGKGLGSALGFATVNVLPPEGLVLPPRGVYAVSTPLGRGVANFGVAPTMGERSWSGAVLEVHLVERGRAKEIEPGEVPAQLEVDFHRFIREERRFASVDDLRAQVEKDIETIGEDSNE